MVNLKEKAVDLKGEWKLQDAKAKFSEVFERARVAGPQKITRHGRDTMVLIRLTDYVELTKPKKPKGNLFEFFSNSPLADSGIDLEREQDYGREVDL